MHKSAAAHPYRTETVCVQAGTRKDTTFNSVAVPIYATSTFAFEAPGKTKGYDYSRTANPTRAALEECLAALEGGAGATATATGMAAETSIMALFPAGSHIIAGHDIYGGTYRLFASVLAARGLRFSFVDMSDPRNVKDAILPETRAIWIETPSNPLLNVVDIAAICAIAKRHGQTTIVDNTFLSPVFQQPLALGADFVVHSTTKYLNGHSDVVGGAIVSRTAEDAVQGRRHGQRPRHLLLAVRRLAGPARHPHPALPHGGARAQRHRARRVPGRAIPRSSGSTTPVCPRTHSTASPAGR